MNHQLRTNFGKHTKANYYNKHDFHWLHPLLELFHLHINKNFSELKTSLQESNNPNWHGQRFQLVLDLLKTIFLESVDYDQKPSLYRQSIFEQAEKIKQSGLSIKNFNESIDLNRLYQDIKQHSIIASPKQKIQLHEFILEANFILAQQIMSQAHKIQIKTCGHSLPIIRSIKSLGLICDISKIEKSDHYALNILGPLSMLRSTKIYQSRFKAILPKILESTSFQLNAIILGKFKEYCFTINKCDPIKKSLRTKNFDSKLEETFYHDFLIATNDWKLIREPQPFNTKKGLVFPDFLIQHKTNLQKFYYLEIIGFWTQDYLKQKVEKYTSLENTEIIFCVKDSLKCDNLALNENFKTIKFKTKIKTKEIFNIIDSFSK